MPHRLCIIRLKAYRWLQLAARSKTDPAMDIALESVAFFHKRTTATPLVRCSRRLHETGTHMVDDHPLFPQRPNSMSTGLTDTQTTQKHLHTINSKYR